MACATRSSPSACAILSASRSMRPRATSTPRMSASTSSRRSTSCAAAATMAGRSRRARSASTRTAPGPASSPTIPIPPAAGPNLGLIDPIAQYDHNEGTAIIGGFVYRGSSIPELRGRYIFGDLSRGRLFALERWDRLLEGAIGSGVITELQDRPDLELLALRVWPGRQRGDLRARQPCRRRRGPEARAGPTRLTA